jgi:glucose-6-phosphate isomerase
LIDPVPRAGETARSRGLWDRYRRRLWVDPELGLSLDLSRIGGEDDTIDHVQPAMSSAVSSAMSSAIRAMADLEAGAIANVDEHRMVGHYWLRAPALAPTPELAASIDRSVESVRSFAVGVHTGAVRGAHGRFEHVIHVGIGGSALGPQLVCDALRGVHDPVRVHFLDNADPDGIDRLIRPLTGVLGRTLVSVVSKSGWTPTPWFGMLELQARYEQLGLPFPRHAVATTMEGTALDARAAEEGWIARFPLWDWVGGGTSVTSAVGLLPAALQGVPVDAFLQGAAAMDRLTRVPDPLANPAALLALAWHRAGNGRGDRDMVVLPYSDRLALFARYVQQLVMESVGKKLDRSGARVDQGLTTYGGKGCTDQHAYMQQLRDGPDNVFLTFLQVAEDRRGPSIEIQPDVTLGDWLFGNLEGSRNALYERGRQSITITLPHLSASSLGAVIALYERAVGLYAELVDLNAYHQPGVDKDAGVPVVDLQRAVLAHLRTTRSPQTAEEVADALGRPAATETVYKLLVRLAADDTRGVSATRHDAGFDARFQLRELVPASRDHVDARDA